MRGGVRVGNIMIQSICVNSLLADIGTSVGGLCKRMFQGGTGEENEDCEGWFELMKLNS